MGLLFPGVVLMLGIPLVPELPGMETRKGEYEDVRYLAPDFGERGSDWQLSPLPGDGQKTGTSSEDLDSEVAEQESGETAKQKKEMPSPPEGYRHWKEVKEATLTAYDPSRRSCGKFADGLTSTGEDAWEMDGVAVDPEVIPYGTIIYIPGIGYRVADDTGAAMQNSWDHHRTVHIDIRMTYHYQARQFGTDERNIHLFRPVEEE